MKNNNKSISFNYLQNEIEKILESSNYLKNEIENNSNSSSYSQNNVKNNSASVNQYRAKILFSNYEMKKIVAENKFLKDKDKDKFFKYMNTFWSIINSLSNIYLIFFK